MPYSAFTVDDFFKDPDFTRWVIEPTDESNRFWQGFLTEHPHKATDIQRAVDYIHMIHFQETNPSEQDLARLKQRIWNDIDHPVRDHPAGDHPVGDHPAERRPDRDHPVRVVRWYQQPYWAAAAVVLLVSAVALGWWMYQANANLTYETAYGKIQEIRLADGSVVTLNAHSSLRVAHNLGTNPVREVWLEGEGYFDITKRPGAKFIVHTPEATVEVLGTEFNVNTRRQQTNVVLREGKVQLSTDNQSTVVMKPGDMAIVTSRSRHIELKRVQSDQYDAWKESYLVLDGKSVPEIISSLEDSFGVTITVEEAELADKKLTGKLRTDVAEDCIDNLAIILGAEVKKSGDTYSFK